VKAKKTAGRVQPRDRPWIKGEGVVVGVTMPFGKFKGLSLDELPDDYLAWLLGVAKPWLRCKVLDELESRTRRTSTTRPAGTDVVNMPTIIRQWWREQCLEHHPDRNGDLKIMQALSNAHDRLKELAGVG